MSQNPSALYSLLSMCHIVVSCGSSAKTTTTTDDEARFLFNKNLPATFRLHHYSASSGSAPLATPPVRPQKADERLPAPLELKVGAGPDIYPKRSIWGSFWIGKPTNRPTTTTTITTNLEEVLHILYNCASSLGCLFGCRALDEHSTHRSKSSGRPVR